MAFMAQSEFPKASCFKLNGAVFCLHAPFFKTSQPSLSSTLCKIPSLSLLMAEKGCSPCSAVARLVQLFLFRVTPYEGCVTLLSSTSGGQPPSVSLFSVVGAVCESGWLGGHCSCCLAISAGCQAGSATSSLVRPCISLTFLPIPLTVMANLSAVFCIGTGLAGFLLLLHLHNLH